MFGIRTSDQEGMPFQRPVPGCAGAWNSPSIQLFKEVNGQPAAAGTDPGSTKKNVPTFIEVKVDRAGGSPGPTYALVVEAWVAMPALGLSPSSKVPGTARFKSETTALPSGSPFVKVRCYPDLETPENLQALGWQPAHHNNKPSPATMANPLASRRWLPQEVPGYPVSPDNKQHFCIFACVYSAVAVPATPTQSILKSNVMVDPCNVQWHAQKNVEVVLNSPDFSHGFDIWSPGEDGERFLVEAVPVGKLGAADRQMLASGPFARLRLRQSQLWPDFRLESDCGRPTEEGLMVEASTQRPIRAIVRATLPRERPLTKGTGLLFPVDLVQRRPDGQVVGGLRLLIVRTPPGWQEECR